MNDLALLAKHKPTLEYLREIGVRLDREPLETCPEIAESVAAFFRQCDSVAIGLEPGECCSVPSPIGPIDIRRMT